jgi:hypothetical protein
MAHTAARYWFRAGRTMPREEAIRMVAMLVWRGIAGFPRLHEGHDEDIAALPLPTSRQGDLSEALAGSPVEGARRTVTDVRHDNVSDVHTA